MVVSAAVYGIRRKGGEEYAAPRGTQRKPHTPGGAGGGAQTGGNIKGSKTKIAQNFKSRKALRFVEFELKPFQDS